MSGLYVYGITTDSARVRTTGVSGRPLRTIAVGRLRAIVESAAGPPRASISSLNAQSRVLAALVDKGVDVLPARFGSFVSGRAELSRAIHARDRELRRAMTRIKGCVQMTLRLHVTPFSRARREVPHGRTGGSYLRERAARASARRSHPLVRAIERAAARHARASHVEWQESTRSAEFRVYHLVPRSRVEAYREAISRALAAAHAHAVLTGPWAPFAFAELA